MAQIKQKNILVLGAGVIGVTSAYYLAKAGHVVTLIDKASQVASEGSYANGGTLSSVHAKSWANVQAPFQFLASIFDKDSIFKMRRSLDPEFLAWAIKFLRYCWPGATNSANKALFNLVIETQGYLMQLLQETGFNIHQNQGGLYLHRDEKSLQAASQELEQLTAQGLDVRLLNQHELFDTDPALSASKINFVGAVQANNDFSADCRLFTESLADYCQTELGTTLQLSSDIQGFIQHGDKVRGVITDQGSFEADEIIVSLGAQTSALLRKLAYKVPIYPVKGYSVSLKIKDPDKAPKYFAVDEGSFVAYSKLGDILRLATYVEFAGYDTTVDDRAVNNLTKIADELFPGACDLDDIQASACLRPMTARGSPYIGPMPGRENLWINSGHGHKGWGACCASAFHLCQLINKATPVPDKDFSFSSRW